MITNRLRRALTFPVGLIIVGSALLSSGVVTGASAPAASANIPAPLCKDNDVHASASNAPDSLPPAGLSERHD